MSTSKTIHILLAIPCYAGHLYANCFQSVLELQKLCMANSILLTVQTLTNESLITRGRNYFVALMLANKSFTHLFFLDSDIVFNPNSVLRMINFDKPIVAGVYPKKGLNFEKMMELSKNPLVTKDNIQALSLDYVVNFDNDNIQVEDGFAKCLYTGTGFLLIQRTVLEQMKLAFPQLNYRNDVGGYNINEEVIANFYTFFDCLICENTKRYLSEDYAFCNRWLKMSPENEIWIDLQCNLTHIGTYAFGGSLGSQLVFIDHMNKLKIEEKDSENK